MAYIDTGAYNKWKQQQQALAQAEEYNAQKSQLDNKYNSGGLGGFLGGLIGGIGKGIGDVGYSLGGLFGTAGASVKDLLEGKAGTAENTNAFKRAYYGAKDDKDAAAKAAGNALSAATTLATTAMPGLAGAGSVAAKAGTSLLGNAAAGAVSGIADEFAQQGADANLESAANRAISGAAAGLATGGLNRKIGNATGNISSKLLNNKLATSTLGRGALSGAVGGATGAGTSAALGGGDVAQAALQGGLQGSLSGATQAGVMSAANAVGQKLYSGIDDMVSGMVNKKAVNRLADGIEKGTDGNIKFVRISKDMLSDINSIRQARGLEPLTQRQVTAYKNAVNNNLSNRYNENPSVMTPNKVAQMAYDALISANAEALPANNSNTINVAPYNEKKYNGTVIGLAEDGGTSLKSIEPRSASRVNALRQQKNDLLSQFGSPLAANQEGGATQTGTSLGEANPLGARNRNIPQNSKNVKQNLMYGESQLGNRTKRGMVSDALSRLGNTLEGAQTNITRAAARDLGIESPGAVIENVRKKTGLTNLETQAKLAKELTGGENSLMDSVQRQALTATEDGKPFMVDTTNIINDVEKIVDNNTNTNTFGSENKRTQFIRNLKRDINSGSTDVISIANKMKTLAADLRGRGIAEPKPADAAQARIYSEIANRLDDLSYSAIPQENVDAMFGATISEMKGRAQQARSNRNDDIAKAYTKLAETLDAEPRTIRAYRTFKKDFVDASKVNRLTSQAETGAAFQMGSSFAGGIKRFANTLLQRPVNAALAKVGSGINSVADTVAEGGSSQNLTQIPRTQVQPISQNTQNIMSNYIGRSQGNIAASDLVQNARKVQEYQNLEDIFGGIGTGTADLLQLSNDTTTTITPAQQQAQAQLADIANGMNLALAAGDISSYTQLANLYKTAASMYELQYPATSSSDSKMTTSEKNQLAKLQSAGTALDELESLYQKAGGGQGIVGGNIANFLGGLGLNSDVNTYNQLAQGLINQIGAAIGKTDSLNTEGEVQRALSLVPKITDDNQTAMNKLTTLRSLLQQNTGTYNQLYGA